MRAVGTSGRHRRAEVIGSGHEILQLAGPFVLDDQPTCLILKRLRGPCHQWRQRRVGSEKDAQFLRDGPRVGAIRRHGEPQERPVIGLAALSAEYQAARPVIAGQRRSGIYIIDRLDVLFQIRGHTFDFGIQNRCRVPTNASQGCPESGKSRITIRHGSSHNL